MKNKDALCPGFDILRHFRQCVHASEQVFMSIAGEDDDRNVVFLEVSMRQLKSGNSKE